MSKPRFVRCPFGVFECRWRRKPILHTPEGSDSRHDYRTDEVLIYARSPEEGWQVVAEAEARRLISELRNPQPPTQAELDFAIDDFGGDGA
jgi:hypothetical protein